MIKRLLYKGEPVLTFKMIDELHKRVNGTAQRAFYRNIDRFKVGKHYIKTTDQCDIDELNGNNEFLTINTDEPLSLRHLSNEGTSSVVIERILIKHHGYLLLVKPFNDDVSWNVQEALIDDYFNIKQLLTSQHKQVSIPYDQQVEALQIEIKDLHDKKEAGDYKHYLEYKKLTEKLAIYESDYMPILEAFVQYGQGLELKIFREYLSKIKWKKRTSVIDGKNVIEVYKRDLEFRIQMFIAQCRESTLTKGLFSHPAINGMFEMRLKKPKSSNKPRK